MNPTRRASAWLRRVMAEPGTSDLNLDDPETTSHRRELIYSKPFLKRIYDDWYGHIGRADTGLEGPMLEIGSGAGYLDLVVHNVIASDVLPVEGIDVALDACNMPFPDSVLRGIAMTNVMHHLPDPHGFFVEASRCLVPGGTVVTIEPWVTGWSRFIYGTLHHEPFDPEAREWTMPAGKPLTHANGALPWIVFERDRSEFSAKHPELELVAVEPFMAFTYLLSGGMSMRALMPHWTFGFWRRLDDLLTRNVPGAAMFATIVIRKNLDPSASPDPSQTNLEEPH